MGRAVTIRDWRPMRKNSLLGFARVELPSGMIIADVTILVGERGPWASPPSKPMGKDGVALTDDKGKIRYSPVIEFASKEIRDRWSAGVVEAMRARIPRCSHERFLGPKRRLGSCLETMRVQDGDRDGRPSRPSARRRHRCRLRQARRQERSSVKGDPRRSSGRSSARRDCACHGADQRTARPNEGAADGLGRRHAREAAGLGDIGRRSALNKLPHLNLDCPADLPTVEITRLASATGPLTKRIRLSDDGALISDGSACLMGRGEARRLRFAGLGAFARLLETLETNEAIALGALAAELPDVVEITTQKKLAALNGHAPSNLIARTAGHITYRADCLPSH